LFIHGSIYIYAPESWPLRLLQRLVCQPLLEPIILTLQA
jgi:hypothetical protein